MIRTLLFTLIFYPGSVYYVGLAPIVALFGQQPIIRHVYRWARFHQWCTRTLLNVQWRIEGPVPTEPVLIAMKHEAMYETVQSLLLFDRPAPVFKRELLNIPLWGQALRRYGGIIVDREAGASAMRIMLAEARALTAASRPILIYPEGTRVPHGQAPEIKSGIAGLYRMLKLPVVPVACDSGRFMPRTGPKRPGTITFRIGETIPPGLPREEFEARVHAAINVLNGRA